MLLNASIFTASSSTERFQGISAPPTPITPSTVQGPPRPLANALAVFTLALFHPPLKLRLDLPCHSYLFPPTTSNDSTLASLWQGLTPPLQWPRSCLLLPIPHHYPSDYTLTHSSLVSWPWMPIYLLMASLASTTIREANNIFMAESHILSP